MASPNNFKTDLMTATYDLSADTIKVALGGDNTSYTFDAANHTFVNDVFDGGTTGEEISDSSYNRQSLTNLSVSQDNTDDEGVFDAADTTFSSLSSSQDIQFIIIYKQVGADDTTPGDDPIIALWDDDSAGSLADLPLSTNGSDVTISWDSEGIVNIT